MNRNTKHHENDKQKAIKMPSAEKVSTKHHAKKKRSPAMLPVPENLEGLLKLVNLVPLHLRQPSSAQRNTEGQKPTWFMMYVWEYLRSNWKPGDSKSEWFRFAKAIEELPLILQAFVLQDEDFEAYEDTGISTDSDLQIFRNFDVLYQSEAELKGIIQASHERMEKTFTYEISQNVPGPLDRLAIKIKAGNKVYLYVESEHLLLRARQRLIFLLAAQETLICLTHPDAWMQIANFRTISKLYDSQYTLRIKQQGEDKGKLYLRPSPLYEPLLGIEANRIRECPVCYKIFWAGRKDQVGCTPQCAKIIRTRRWREKAIEYEANRAKKERLAITKPKPNPQMKGM